MPEAHHSERVSHHSEPRTQLPGMVAFPGGHSDFILTSFRVSFRVSLMLFGFGALENAPRTRALWRSVGLSGRRPRAS